MDSRTLLDAAISAMQSAYAPYSHFQVGAALLTQSGEVYTGCNIENAAYSCTVCAERTAFFTAVRDGHRKFSKIAVVGGMNGVLSSFTYPCGVCRQVMREFCDDDFTLIFTDGTAVQELKLSDLLPYSFSPANLNEPHGGSAHENV
ncbi:MAG: cytidine deaminase [Clostridia bacterium]|nr:cytidine deaminase [Clostridia bacterium]MBQ8333303.1 cytidine deaminase [Clostridia bacterium]MBQ8370459.1 cytidine deaminase [Clostridia bacterium]MBQ8513344.1 cytidine deaminase [Clostridia bacterium]